MALDPNREDLVIGVVGTGAMGRGIMQVAAQGGMRVIAYDEKKDAAEAALQQISRIRAGLVEEGRVDRAAADAAVGASLSRRASRKSPRQTSLSKPSWSVSTPSKTCTRRSTTWPGRTQF